MYDAWYNLAPTCPQLYLYSAADPLAPPGDVERYMGVQVRGGRGRGGREGEGGGGREGGGRGREGRGREGRKEGACAGWRF